MRPMRRTGRKLPWLAIVALVVVVVAAAGVVGCGDLLREVASQAGVIDRGYLGKGVVAGKVVRSEVDWRHA